MKKIVLLIFSIFLVGCLNKSEPQKHMLMVKKQFCKIEQGGVVFLPEFKLFQNNILINEYKPELLKNHFLIDNLNQGDYTIQYSTMFRMKESIDFSIKTKEIDTVTICVDKISYNSVNHTPFIEKLKINENFIIDVWSQGCVSLGGSQIRIKKLKDGFFIKSKDLVKKLTSEEIESIKRFELELINMNYGGCTTTDIYTLKYNQEELIVKDGSCHWFGYTRLLNSIFKENN